MLDGDEVYWTQKFLGRVNVLSAPIFVFIFLGVMIIS